MGFADLIRSARSRDDYWIEDAIIKFTLQLYSRMGSLSQEELGARIGVSQPYIARILRGNNNFTIATMVKLARAIGGHLDLTIRDGEEDGTVTGVGELSAISAVTVNAITSTVSTSTQRVTLVN